jgi:hypothetical protein
MTDTGLTREASDIAADTAAVDYGTRGATTPDGRPTSRDTEKGAGWGGPGNLQRTAQPERGTYTELLKRRHDPPAKPFSWISFDSFREAINDFWTARVRTGIIDEERGRRVAAQRAAGIERLFPDFVVDRTDLDAPSFVLIGDPGEGDESQYAVVAPLLEAAGDTDFMVVCSDVVYPAGDVNQYADKFFVPYAEYPQTIYALPGNHDWFDLLDGFMFAFCGAEPLPRSNYRGSSYRPLERIARRLWRRSSRPNRPLLTALRNRRPPWRDGPPRPAQPGPYFAIDTGPLRLVCIDTGVKNVIDHEQAEWLLRVSAGPKPKILLTGRPIYADYEYEPSRIAWGDDALMRKWGAEPEGWRPATVDDVVRRAEHNYVAAVGGDTHNYQRYPVRVGDRTIQYVVSGGGGAYMHETHGLDPRRRPEVPEGVMFPAEADIKLYPLRGDSLTLYTSLVVPWLRSALKLMVMATVSAIVTAGVLVAGLLGDLPVLEEVPEPVGIAVSVAAVVWAIVSALILMHLLNLRAHRAVLARGDLRNGRVPPDVASRFIGDRFALTPERRDARAAGVDERTRKLLEVVAPLETRGSPIYSLFSELFDTNEPPFFKHFLRCSVDGDKLRFECFGVTGWRDDEHDPPREDSFEIDLGSAERVGSAARADVAQ